jgi:hypothetical protein
MLFHDPSVTSVTMKQYSTGICLNQRCEGKKTVIAAQART